MTYDSVEKHNIISENTSYHQTDCDTLSVDKISKESEEICQ